MKVKYYHRTLLLYRLSILLILPSIALGQTAIYTLRGKVIDNQSKYPLIGVSVALLENKTGMMTDTSGLFNISNRPIS
jgi:CarboxypepD_reg-like domain